MSNVMEALYNEWAENSMNTKEADTAFDVLCIGNDKAEYNEKMDVLAYAINAESRVAFTAGFKTAVKLLMGGGQE